MERRRHGNSEMGYGAFATGPVAAGGVVLRENPLCCQQTIDNTQDVMACPACLAFIDSVSAQVEFILLGGDRFGVYDPSNLLGMCP